VTETIDVANGMVAIDTMMANRPKVTSAYLLRALEPALVETGPTTSLQSVLDGLDQLGVGPHDLAHVVVTHIHLDHAGGVGTLAGRFPEATVWVHDRGARHLADPTKLVASAGRVYGEQRLRELFGPVDPVPAERIRSLSDGDTVALGNRSMEVLYTPGHASHHISLIDSDTGALFTGDALGIHLPDVGVLRPATPPPDIDVELSVDSIERIRRRARSVLMFSHFGPVQEVDALCDLAIERWRKWARIVREAMDQTDDVDRISEILGVQTADEFGDAKDRQADIQRYELLATMRMNAMGLVRYWKKRDEAEGKGSPAQDREGAAPERSPRR
jgi:glyoxylase-like metal-dependent hydrolase (beta-lactamase superfamily II)